MTSLKTKILPFIFVLLICGQHIMLKAQNLSKEKHIIQLDLQQAVRIATDSSLEAFKAKNLFLAGYWQYRSYEAEKLPQLSLRTVLMDYNRALTKRYNSELDIDEYKEQENIYSFGNLSVSQALPFSGGSLYFDTEFGRLENFGYPSPVQYSTVPVRLGLNQTLFGFNKYKWQKKIEPEKYELAQKNYLQSAEKISGELVVLYFNLLISSKKQELAKLNMHNADTLYAIGQERLKIASLSQSEVLTLKVDLLNAKDQFAIAKKELQKATFSFYSYLRLTDTIQIELQVPDNIKFFEVQMDKAISEAFVNNPELISNNQRRLEAERDVDQAIKDNRFNAELNASVGYNQLSNNFEQVYADPLDQQRVMLSFTIPIVDWGQNRGKYKLAQYNYEVVKTTAEQLTVDFKERVLMAVTDMNTQQSIVSSTLETRDVAIMAHETTKARFLLGKSDVNSLSLALDRRDNAEINYLTSLKDYWQYYYTLRQLTLYNFEMDIPLSVDFEQSLGLK